MERIEEPLQHHVRLVGTSVASLVGYGLSGSILEDIYAVEVRDAVIRPYVMAHEEAAPVFSRTAFQRRGDTIMQRYERLVLPVAGSCETDPAFFYIWFDVRHFAPDAAGAEVETEVILLPRQSSRSVAAA